MSALTLTLAAAPTRALDLSALTPAALSGLKATALRRLRLPVGNRTVALGELFEITGDDARSLRLVGLNGACHHIGRGLREGRIEVEGAVGDELGREMRGGEIRVSGNAGAGAGMGMRGGFLHIEGCAGEAVGGLTPGATCGMNGGVIVVGRNVGQRCGERMRRGFVVVAGDAGEYLGDRMLAGTIAVLGHTAAHVGFGMRRGSLLLVDQSGVATAAFADCGEFELGVITLMRHYLAAYHPALARRLAVFTRVRRWAGDTAYGSKGEILIAGAC